MSDQVVDLTRPLVADREGNAPYALKVVVKSKAWSPSGPIVGQKVEDYVLWSALPDELREQVRTAIQLKLSGY